MNTDEGKLRHRVQYSVVSAVSVAQTALSAVSPTASRLARPNSTRIVSKAIVCHTAGRPPQVGNRLATGWQPAIQQAGSLRYDFVRSSWCLLALLLHSLGP